MQPRREIVVSIFCPKGCSSYRSSFRRPPEGLSGLLFGFRGSSRRAVRDIVRGTVRPPPEGLSGVGVHPCGWEVVNPSCGDLHRRSTPTLLPLRFESVRIRSNLVCSLHSDPGRARCTEIFCFLSRSPTVASRARLCVDAGCDLEYIEMYGCCTI